MKEFVVTKLGRTLRLWIDNKNVALIDGYSPLEDSGRRLDGTTPSVYKAVYLDVKMYYFKSMDEVIEEYPEFWLLYI